MSQPLILCICLDPGGRPDFIERTKRCMQSQTQHGIIPICRDTSNPKSTVGDWRNKIIQDVFDLDNYRPDYIAHFDWDDISAPDRLQRQLEFIERTGKLVTGFYDMPMHDARKDKVWIYRNDKTNYALGTSLFYRREAWERVKFPDKTPEDNIWRHRVGLENCESQSVFREDGTPMMVQVVHGGNASARIFPGMPRFKEPTPDQDRAVREMLKA